jgi:hypothetical protein
MTNQKSIKFMAAILLGICCAKASEELQPRQTIPVVDSSMTQSPSKNNDNLELCKNLPQELLPPIILPLPFFDRLKVREVSKIWQTTVDSIHKSGPYLEELVYAISQHKSVTLVLKRIETLECYPSREKVTYEYKLPNSLEMFRNWCSKGYEEGSEYGYESGYFTNYSPTLFKFGIENNYVPFVNFVLEQYPATVTKSSLTDIDFEIEGAKSKLFTYVFRKNSVGLFDVLIRNEAIRDICFKDTDNFKNHLGNTPLHTVIKYGSPDMIKKFLGQTELMEICLAPENIKGAEGKNPLQFAEMREDSQIIKQILLENKELTDSCS